MEADQVTLWNEAVGDAWVEHADHFDETLQPFGDAAFDRLSLTPGDRVIDIGCGTGSTTLRIGEHVAPGRVVGVDVSAPMLAAARARIATAGCSNVEFLELDVQESSLGRSEFDAAFSRMGVMFFPEPVRAFTRINESLVEGGRLSFVCFQSPPQNPFIVVPIMVAAGRLGVGPPDPTQPNPFSFADPATVTRILQQAGFVDVVIEPGPTQADLGDAHDLPQLAKRLVEQNPSVSPAFTAATPDVRAATVEAVVEALRPHVVDDHLTMAAASWVVTARGAHRNG
jgi:ubiquinone/menaquinone biosynthesis C-methylase UbiE